MRSRLLLMMLPVGMAEAACAEGSQYVGGGGADLGGGSSTITSVTTGAGGASTSSPSSSSTSSTSGSSSGSCPDSPCKLTVPQCGCPSGEACTVSNYAITCLLVGTTPEGQTCSGGTDCAAGSLCVGGGSVGICNLFCTTDADCAATGGICALNLSDGNGGALPGATLCSSACDLTTNAGCPTGTACQLGQEQTGQMRYLTYCASAGSLGSEATCNPNLEQCAPTFGCFNNGTSDVCLQYCYVSNINACGGLGCSALTNTMTMGSIVVGGKEIGVCP